MFVLFILAIMARALQSHDRMQIDEFLMLFSNGSSGTATVLAALQCKMLLHCLHVCAMDD